MIESESKERSGRIQVHTPEILEEIVADNDMHDLIYTKDELSKHNYPRSASAPIPSYCNQNSSCNRFPARSTALSSAPLQGCRVQTWLDEDSVRNIQERSNLESRSVRNLYRTVLDNEESLVNDVDTFLEYTDVANKNRRAELFKKWSDRVYIPLQERIKVEMKSGNFKTYEKKKRQLYDRYIDYRNRKGMVFLDVFSPEEYDPLELNSHRPGPLKAKIKNLDQNDPLLYQDFKRTFEEQDMIRCLTGRTARTEDVTNYHLPPQPFVPLGRQNTTCKTWLRMPIHHIDSPPRLKSRQRMNLTGNQSQIDFPKWQNYSKPRPEVVDTEIQRQKKKLFPEKYSSRRILEWPAVPVTYQMRTMRNDIHANSNI